MAETGLSRKFHAIINAITTGDLDVFDSLVRYDIVDHNRILSQGDGLPGLKYWAKSMRQALPDLTATVQDTITEENKIAARVLWAGTHTGEHIGVPATNSYLEFESFYILRFSQGVAVEWWDGSDTRDALRQAGAKVTIPAPE